MPQIDNESSSGRYLGEDITPKDELAKLESAQTHPKQTRKKGQGRPTKRERRIMDQLQGKF